jgi:uncharacterized membrane protein YcjF (UPF0283 family)
MTDSTKDIVKADPIETLHSASKVSLQGGGVLLVVAIAAVYQKNADPAWTINDWHVFTLIAGAVFLGIVGTVARVIDAMLRVQLTLKLLEVKGTADAGKAEDLPVVSTPPSWVPDVRQPLFAYIIKPDEKIPGQSDT